MRFFLYRFRDSLKRMFAFRFLLFFLIFSLTSPTLFAQQQRRGLFLQDDLPSQRSGESFRDTDFGPQFGREDQEALEREEMMRSSRRGISGGVLFYQVHVLGEVNRPGTYRVSPSMRVTDALFRAGGILKNGSQRFVELRSAGQTGGRILDLFAYKTLGKVSQNPYLQDNQTIYVPLRKQAVEIEGPVRRPGLYELKNEKTLQDLVGLAGGFTIGASKGNPIRIIRYFGRDEKEILENSSDPSEMSSFFLQDGDVVIVPHKFLTKHQFDYNLRELPNDNIFYPAFEDKVFVIGGVKAPGAFKFNQYYSLRQYLTLAGGTTIMAKRGKIKVVTVEGKTIKAKHGIYDGVINPGDTIVVPEKSVPTSFYIGLMPTIASLGLSAVALFK